MPVSKMCLNDVLKLQGLFIPKSWMYTCSLLWKGLGNQTLQHAETLHMCTQSMQKARQHCMWWLWAHMCVQLPQLWEILVIIIIINGHYKFPSNSTLSAGWNRQAGFWRQPALDRSEGLFFPCCTISACIYN